MVSIFLRDPLSEARKVIINTNTPIAQGFIESTAAVVIIVIIDRLFI
jgi:hypothetical protein